MFNDAQKTCKCSYCCPLPKGPELSQLSTSVRQSSIVVSQRLPGLKHMSYNERLQYLGLSSLELRRLHLDMIYCNKIVFGVVDLKFSDFFEFSSVTATRGHAYKLYKPSCVNSTRSRYFAIYGTFYHQVWISLRWMLSDVPLRYDAIRYDTIVCI